MKIKIVITIIIAWLAISCSTGKKLDQANQNIGALNSELVTLKSENKSLGDSIHSLNRQSEASKKASDQCNTELTEAKVSRAIATQRYLELSRCLEEQTDSLQQIKRKAIRDFSGFDKSVVDVKYRNGMVYISVQNEFMFPSGRTIINPGGKKALAIIANILSEYSHVTAIVVGNTDSIDVARGFKDNWSLSTERANTIVRYLLSNYGADPTRLIAAGKSKFSPVASNSDPDGRAKNRRTDIIFNPDLNKLWLLSQKYP